MLKVFCAPARYVQGRDATMSLASELSRLGISGKALIIASPTARKALEPAWRETFPAAGLDYAILDFGGECSFAEIARGKEEARRVSAASIVGAGGGKTLDAARAVAAELELPVACCPTTASSDAPCSALSVVYSEDGVFEKCLFYRRNPDLVLVDSTVIARAPVRLLISGMGDALATFFEADATIRAHRKNVARGPEHNRRGRDRRALLQNAAQRRDSRRRRGAGRVDHAGAGTHHRSQHAALRPRVRVGRPCGGAFGPQWADGRAGNA